MRHFLNASLTSAVAAAFVNTNTGSKLYICATPQQADLTKTAFEALTYILVKGLHSLGETGNTTNMLSYSTWDTDVIQKAKGDTDAGSPEIEVARIADDPGQLLLATMAATNLNYAFKIESNDKPNANVASKPTIRYNRGLVTGPKQPNGQNEDFDIDMFSLGLNQKQIRVDPVLVV